MIMGIVVRVLQWQRQLRLTNLGHGRCRLFSSCGSPCLLLPPGIGIKNNGKDMLLFCQSKEEKIKATTTGYHHFLDMGKNPLRIRDIEINIRTMWRGRYLSPEKGRAECVGSSRGWAVFLDRETCDLYLFNFWIKNDHNPNRSNNIRFPYIPLPPIETLPTILTRETALMGTWIDYEYYKDLSPIPISVTQFVCHKQTYDADAVSSEELSQDFIKRVALSRAPTPLSYTKKKIDEEEECSGTPPPMVMIIHGHEEEGKGQLAFCRLGDAAWTSLNHNNSTTSCFPYKDITYFTPHGKFYALTKSQNLEVWDLSCPSSPQVKILKTAGIVSKFYEEENREYYRNMYLVESEGKLLMVIEHYSKGGRGKNWFDVFVLMEPKLEEEQGKGSSIKSDWEWMKITSLNGRILFLGINDSVSLPSHEFPGLIPNSIYFATRHYTKEYSYPGWRGEDIGVYDLTHQSVSRFMGKDNIFPFPTWIFRSKAY